MSWNVASNPVVIMGHETGSGHHIETVAVDSRYGQIAFDSAAAVKQLGVDDRADRAIDTVGADPLTGRTGIGTGDHELAKRGLIKDSNPFSGSLVLKGRVAQPVLMVKRVFIFRLYTFGRKPVRSLPAQFFAKAGTLRSQ